MKYRDNSSYRFIRFDSTWIWLVHCCIDEAGFHFKMRLSAPIRFEPLSKHPRVKEGVELFSLCQRMSTYVCVVMCAIVWVHLIVCWRRFRLFPFGGMAQCAFRSLVKIAYKSVLKFGATLRRIGGPCLVKYSPKNLSRSNTEKKRKKKIRRKIVSEQTTNEYK